MVSVGTVGQCVTSLQIGSLLAADVFINVDTEALASFLSGFLKLLTCFCVYEYEGACSVVPHISIS